VERRIFSDMYEVIEITISEKDAVVN
jgi:hypothetical protein